MAGALDKWTKKIQEQQKAKASVGKTVGTGGAVYSTPQQKASSGIGGGTVTPVKASTPTVSFPSPKPTDYKSNNIGGMDPTPIDTFRKFETPKTTQAMPQVTIPQDTTKNIETQTKKGKTYEEGIKEMADMFRSLLGGLPKAEAYKSEYDPQIMQTLKNIQNQQFSYDPMKDTMLQQAQQQAMLEARKQGARVGRTFDPYTQIKEQQMAQQLVPQYQQMARQDYQQNLQNQFNVLNMLRNLDQTGYGRTQDLYGLQRQEALTPLDWARQAQQTQFGQDIAKAGVTGTYMEQPTLQAQQQQFAQGIAEAGVTGKYKDEYTPIEQQRLIDNELIKKEKIKEQEISRYGTELTPATRPLATTYENFTPQEIQQLGQYGAVEGGYGSSINRLRQTGENPQLLQQLEAMRFNKVMSDPSLLAQYGVSDYGLPPKQVFDITQSYINKNLSTELAKLKNRQQHNEGLKTLAEIDKMSLQQEEILSNIANKDEDTINKQLQGLLDQEKLFQERLTTANLPNEFKQKANESLSIIGQRNASAIASMASAQASKIGQQLTDEKIKTEQITQQEKIENVLKKEKERLQDDEDVIKESFNDYFISGLTFDDWYRERGQGLSGDELASLLRIVSSTTSQRDKE